MDKKIKLLPLLLLTAAVFLLIFYLRLSTPPGKAINIDTGLSYPTVQKAIDAPETKDGHTIIVYPCLYRENIQVNKTLTIKGQDVSSTILERGDRSVIALLITAENVTVANLTVRNSAFGIWSLNTNGSEILSNKVVNCSTSIRLDFSSNSLVKDNKITDGMVRGIHLYRSFNNTIIKNEVKNITQAYGAIHLEYSHNNTIMLNQFMNNTCGIWIDSSSNNKIYHNNFIHNTKHVHSGDSNVWDDGYPSGGNYWSNYSGIDADSDKIGDTPYVIDEKNKDRYPLMEPLAIS